MSTEDGEISQLSNNFWICDKLFDVGDDNVRDHCHITGKCRGYDSHLIMQKIGTFDVKVNVIPNGLEKYMAFTINKNLFFIESMQFMNSSLDSLVKDFSDDDFKYLSEEYSGEFSKLVKQKRVYPYEYMDSFKKFSEDKLPDKCKFLSS